MRASAPRWSPVPTSWRAHPLAGVVALAAGSLAVSLLVGVPGTSATAAAPVPSTSPLKDKKYWNVALGSFPSKPAVWWRLSDYALDTTDGRRGTVSAYEREWQQWQDVVPQRKRIGVIQDCNPNPVGKESKDCEFYHTLPTAVRLRKGSFTYQGNSTQGVLSISWDSYTDQRPPITPPTPTATPPKGSAPKPVKPTKPKPPVKLVVPPKAVKKRQDNPALAVQTETWTITVQRDGKLGAAKLQSTLPAGLPTEGRGYGSRQDFQSFHSAEDIENIGPETPAWLGSSRVMERGALLNWRKANMPIAPLQVKSADGQSLYWSDNGVNTMSALFEDDSMRAQGPGNGCKQGQEDMKGMNNYLWVSDNSRYLVWQSHKRCLTARGTAPYVDGPGFKAGMHIEMLTQVLDDDGDLVGAIGGEASSSGMDKGKGWGSFGIHDLVNPPR